MMTYRLVLLTAAVQLFHQVACQVDCLYFDYLNFRSVNINDTDIQNMNFAYSDENQTTYFSLCNDIDSSIVQSLGMSNSTSYTFISCQKDWGCFGLKNEDMITSLPKKVSPTKTIYQIIFKHPKEKIPIIISFPDDSIEISSNSSGTNNGTVKMVKVSENIQEYDPINYYNYSFRVKTAPSLSLYDVYLFGPDHYMNSWIWAVVGVSFMLSSACFHNFLTTSGRLSSFTFFIYFYVTYRTLDWIYCSLYSPQYIVATTSVIIFPGFVAYVLTYVDNIMARNVTFGKPCF